MRDLNIEELGHVYGAGGKSDGGKGKGNPGKGKGSKGNDKHAKNKSKGSNLISVIASRTRAPLRTPRMSAALASLRMARSNAACA